MFPLVALLFIVAATGALAAAISLLFPPTRFLAPFVFFPWVCAPPPSLCLFFAVGIAVEALGASEWLTNASMFVGLGGGFLAGAALGLFIAWKVARRLRLTRRYS